MTALWRSGAEMAPIGTTGEFAVSVGSVSQDSVIKRSGTYSLKYTGSGHSFPTFPTVQGVAVRSYIHLTGTPGVSSMIMGAGAGAGGDHFCGLRLRTDRKLDLALNGFPAAFTTLATSSFAIPTGSFEQCLELWCDLPTKTLSARYNFEEWARVVVPGFLAAGDIGFAYFGPAEATMTGCDIRYDDMAINSLTGTYNNTWCGPSAGVHTFWPVAPITSTVELVSWNVVGAGSVWEALDEPIPNDNTDYIRETAGAFFSTAGFHFPDWPIRTPASCMLLGLRGGGTAATSRLASLHMQDSQAEFVAAGISPTVDWNLNGYKTVYPMLRIEEAIDGTKRMLSNKYLNPSNYPVRTRFILVRNDAVAAEIRMTSVWMTVDFPYANPVLGVPPSTPQTPQILVNLDP